tara:strand:- start:795 stop:2027 length:1233 start_codon:yes stop_codon:yes gene_type:complete
MYCVGDVQAARYENADVGTDPANNYKGDFDYIKNGPTLRWSSDGECFYGFYIQTLDIDGTVLATADRKRWPTLGTGGKAPTWYFDINDPRSPHYFNAKTNGGDPTDAGLSFRHLGADDAGRRTAAANSRNVGFRVNNATLGIMANFGIYDVFSRWVNDGSGLVAGNKGDACLGGTAGCEPYNVCNYPSGKTTVAFGTPPSCWCLNWPDSGLPIESTEMIDAPTYGKEGRTYPNAKTPKSVWQEILDDGAAATDKPLLLIGSQDNPDQDEPMWNAILMAHPKFNGFGDSMVTFTHAGVPGSDGANVNVPQTHIPAADGPMLFRVQSHYDHEEALHSPAPSKGAWLGTTPKQGFKLDGDGGPGAAFPHNRVKPVTLYIKFRIYESDQKMVGSRGNIGRAYRETCPLKIQIKP